MSFVQKKRDSKFFKSVKFTGTFFSLLIVMFLMASCQKADGQKVGKSSGSDKNSLSNKVGPRVGFKAPNFTLPDLDGNQISLSDLKGHVVMLNFWATWCGPCKIEMPSLQELEDQLSGKKFKILALSNDYQGVRIVKPYIEKYGYTFTNLIDKNFEVNDMYKVHSIPTTMLIDQDGVITNKFFGARNWSSSRYKDLITKLIKSGSNSE